MALRFATEADMLGYIAAAAPTLAGPRAVAVFEVQSAAGVPDVVAAVLDPPAVADLAQVGFITDQAKISALLALSDALLADAALNAVEVATAAGVSTRYVTSSVMPELVDRGVAVALGSGLWTAKERYRSPALRLVTVEAKLRDWRRGLGQAARHAAGADAAWLVLDSQCTRPAETRTAWFSTAGVGLAGIDQEGVLSTLLQPTGGEVLRERRELLAQRVAALCCSGATSGPISRVFGRHLTSTIGLDPRLSGAAVR